MTTKKRTISTYLWKLQPQDKFLIETIVKKEDRTKANVIRRAIAYYAKNVLNLEYQPQKQQDDE